MRRKKTVGSNGIQLKWLTGVLVVLAAASGCSSPTWYIDPGFAENVAKKENKPILFYFKEWDSTQHRNMREKVLKDSAVKSELMDTVNVELEFTWSDPYKQRYNVTNSQVCVLCDSQGRKIGSAIYVNPVPAPEKFLEWLRTVKAGAKSTMPTSPPKK